MTDLRALAEAVLGASPEWWARRQRVYARRAFREAASPAVVLALLDVVEVARLPRNTYIYDNPEFMGEWVAVPSADFEALRAALARYEEVSRDPA